MTEPDKRTAAASYHNTPPADSVTPASSGDQVTQKRSEPTALPADLATPNVPGYVLSRKLGEGGMGAVYLAHDPTFDRDVAVKVMHPRQSAARFVTESKVTAQLPHPGVPPVYALGETADGRPFLAMKLVEGRTLSEELPSVPNAADVLRLLGVLERICETVGFAHSRGIVHRDLKPQNVMVGAFGEVLVMDWGIAKSVGEPQPAGEGTPAYMSPEQARGGAVDPRADVYALGGILTAILTGRPSVAGLSTCPADAELVEAARRCLEADADGRFADGREVAAAVAAYRAGVEERLRMAERERAAAEARAAEQRKKRRVQGALAAALLVLLAGGGAFLWWEGRQAAAREQQATRNAAAIERLVDRAEGHLERGASGPAAAALVEAEGRLDEPGGEGLRGRVAAARADLTMLDALDKIDQLFWQPSGGALRFREAPARWAEAFRAFGIEPGRTAGDAAARRVVGSRVREPLLAALERWHASAPSPALAALLDAADPDAYRGAVRAALAEGDDARVRELAARPDAESQPPRFAAALGISKAVPDARQEQVLVATADRRPDDVAVLMTLALMGAPPAGDWANGEKWLRAVLAARPDSFAAWNNLGAVLKMRGDRDGALRCYRQAVRLAPDDPKARTNLGTALADRDDLDGAIEEYRRAIRLNPNLFMPHYNLGNTLAQRGDHVAAVAAFREAVRVEPGEAAGHNNLGLSLRAVGDRAGAVAAFQEALRLDPKNGVALTNLNTTLAAGEGDGVAFGKTSAEARKEFQRGMALLASGDRAGAADALRGALKLDPNDPVIHNNLGGVLSELGDGAGAVAAAREAVRLAPKDARYRTNLGDMLRGRRDWDAAIDAHREAIRLDPNLAAAHANLGKALNESGRAAAAVEAYREATRLDPKDASAFDGLGLALQATSDIQGAITAHREAVRLAPKNAAFHTNLATTYMAGRKFADAIQSGRAAVALNPKLSNAHAVLGYAAHQAGDMVTARAALTEATRLDKRWANLLAQLPPLPVAPPPRPVNR